jgi:hypothetical protein
VTAYYAVPLFGHASGTVLVAGQETAFTDASLDAWLAVYAAAVDGDPALAGVRAAAIGALAGHLASVYADVTGSAVAARAAFAAMTSLGTALAGTVATPSIPPPATEERAPVPVRDPVPPPSLVAQSATQDPPPASAVAPLTEWLRWAYAVEVDGLGPDLLEVEVRWNDAEPLFAALARFVTAWPALSAEPPSDARDAALRERAEEVAAALAPDRFLVDLTGPATVTVYARDDRFPTVGGTPPGTPRAATFDGDDGWRAATYDVAPGPRLRLAWAGLDLGARHSASASVRAARNAALGAAHRTAAAFVSRTPWVSFAGAVAPLVVVPHLAGAAVEPALAPFGVLAGRFGGTLRVAATYAYAVDGLPVSLPVLDGSTEVASAADVTTVAETVAATLRQWLAGPEAPPRGGAFVLAAGLTRDGGPSVTVQALDLPVPDGWWPAG